MSAKANDPAAQQAQSQTLDDVVAELLGRRPQGVYAVAVTRHDGAPVVLANDPFLLSGRPMPTRYWLIDPMLNKAIGTLESTGGVKAAEAAVDPLALRAAHDAYGRERDALIGPDHVGPRPSGGVGGTRTGVKCLHAHYGYFLVGGDDPVGRWVHEKLGERGDTLDDLVVLHHVKPSRAGRSSVALIEVGSGSVKALRYLNGELSRWTHATAMFSELDEQGSLSNAGRSTMTTVLTSLRESIGPVDDVAVVATEALRRFQSAEISELVMDTFGCELLILDGRREAELGYQAVADRAGPPTPRVDDRPIVTIDIGYGSTEFATRNAADKTLTLSLPIGAFSVTEQHLLSDPPRPEELSAALSVIELYLGDIQREQPELALALDEGGAEIVAVGATRYIAEVELGVNDADDIDGYILTHSAAEEVFRALATEAAVDRAANPGLSPEHVDWIVGAMCILVEFMRQFAVPHVRIAVAGVIDGMLAEKLASLR